MFQEKAAPKDVREAAVSVSRFDEQSAWGAENPATLIKRRGMGIIDEMRLDDALGAYIDMKKSARLCTDFKIVEASDDPDDVERKEFVEHVIEQMQGSLKEKLRSILSALEYGFSVTNKPSYLIETGPFDGKIGIWNLKTKEPHGIRFKLDAFRNVTGILAEDPNTGQWMPLEPKEFIVYTYRKEFENPYGQSDFLRAYRWWNSKKWVGEMWDMWLERFAGGFLDVSFTAGKQNAQEHAVMSKLINDVQSPRTGAIHSDVYTVKLTEPSGRGNESYREAIAERNIYMARAVLIPDLLGFSQRPGGAFALGKKHFDIFLQVVADIGKDLEETVMQEQFIRPLIDLNWPGVFEYPRFQFDPISEDQMVQILTLLVSAVEKGIIAPDSEIENFVREKLGLPPKAEETVPIRPGAAPAGNGGGPAGPPGSPSGGEFDRTPLSRFQAPKLRRALNSFERKVDFDSLIQTIADVQLSFSTAWSEIMKSARDQILARLKKKQVIENRDTNAIDELPFPRRQDLEKSLSRLMVIGVYYGALQVQEEIVRAMEMRAAEFGADMFERRFAAPLEDLPIDEIETFFIKKKLVVSPAIRKAVARIKRESFFITGVQTKKILDEAKQIMFRGIRKGDPNWAAAELRKVFDGYIELGKITDGALGEAFRVETIIRTNFTTALNEGRRVKFEDPDVEEFIVAYQWSSVLDDATTAYCETMDGKVFQKEELRAEGFPPAHFNCRSIVIPITQGEQFEFSKIPAIERGAGFTSWTRAEGALEKVS